MESCSILPIRSHSMVWSKKNSHFIGFKPLIKRELIEICSRWYKYITCTKRRDLLLRDNFIINIKHEILILSHIFFHNQTCTLKSSGMMGWYFPLTWLEWWSTRYLSDDGYFRFAITCIFCRAYNLSLLKSSFTGINKKITP